MQLMYRVLNQFDIACDPLFNGIASKKLIYDLTMSYLCSREKEFLDSLTDIEKDLYCKENMLGYINTHKHKLKKKIDKNINQIHEKLLKLNFCDSESWFYLLYYLSTLNSHLSHGSKIYTDWVSASKDLNSIMKYYKEQDIHKIAVLASSSGGLLDDNTIVIDLSSKDIIRDILPLISKKTNGEDILSIIKEKENLGVFPTGFYDKNLFVPTSEKFMGFNFSVSDKEMCIYRGCPSRNVISVLERLQIDLIALKMFNFDFFKLSAEEQVKQLCYLKELLKRKIVKCNDPYMLMVFNEMYLNNKNINDVRLNIFENSKINHSRVEILKLVRKIPNIQIKK